MIHIACWLRRTCHYRNLTRLLQHTRWDSHIFPPHCHQLGLHATYPGLLLAVCWRRKIDCHVCPSQPIAPAQSALALRPKDSNLAVLAASAYVAAHDYNRAIDHYNRCAPHCHMHVGFAAAAARASEAGYSRCSTWHMQCLHVRAHVCAELCCKHCLCSLHTMAECTLDNGTHLTHQCLHCLCARSLA
jgi:hypothetical protein